MPKCHQCDRPALNGYQADGGVVELCLEHSVMFEALAERRIANSEREQNFLLDQMDEVTGLPPSGARYPARPQPVVVAGGVTLNKVRVEPGAIVGVVNAGSSVGTIDVAITSIEQHDQQLAEAIIKLTEAIGNSTDVNSQSKAELLELVGGIASEATQPKAQRRRFMVAPLLSRLADLATVSAGVKEAWDLFGPVILEAFK